MYMRNVEYVAIKISALQRYADVVGTEFLRQNQTGIFRREKSIRKEFKRGDGERAERRLTEKH